jgi:hypothetical protein
MSSRRGGVTPAPNTNQPHNLDGEHQSILTGSRYPGRLPAQGARYGVRVKQFE